MKRVAIYARVSSKDKGQDAQQQLPDLRRYAEQIGAEVVIEYVEEKSGATSLRPQFQALLMAGGQRRFDLVLFWSLDRFSQEGPRVTLNHLHTLHTCDVRFRSYTEPYLEITTPIGEATVALVAAQAAQALIARSGTPTTTTLPVSGAAGSASMSRAASSKATTCP